jgi:hypothetical protein
MSKRVVKAGQSSKRKYDELTRSWRRRNWRVFLAVGTICGALLLGTFAASTVQPRFAWTFGLLGGAAFAFFMTAWISPPGWVENWQLGAWGEEATGKALRVLEAEGWVVLHDLPAGQGNVDHIVVGTGGVFLLDSKRLGGSVTVRDGVVTVRRRDDPNLRYTHHGAGHLLSLARQTHDRVRAATRINTWVAPVMVIWADFPQGAVDDRCAYVHGDQIAEWLRSRPQIVAPGRVPQVANAVRAAWIDVPPPQP